ncbi:MAG: ribokinase [Chloroflexota bacterium]
MSKIIVLGSINMDVVVTVASHPQLGETIFGEALHYFPGGKGSNQAVAANRLGGDVQLIGRLGEDAFGKTMYQFLIDEQLDLTHLQTIQDAPTGTALITVSKESENTIVVVSGANLAFDPEDMQQVTIQPDDVIVSQFEVPQPALLALFRRAREVGADTVLNPAPAQPFIDGLLPLASYLVVNETELAYFAGVPPTEDYEKLTEAARNMRSPSQTIIVTLGKRGLFCVDKDDVIIMDGHPVKAVDTTGAGDCFVGALAVALNEQMSLNDALAFANRAASISVQRMGAATSLPYRNELT